MYTRLAPGQVGCQALPHMVAPGPLVGDARSLHRWVYSIGMLRADASLLVDRALSPCGWLQDPGGTRTGASPLMDR